MVDCISEFEDMYELVPDDIPEGSEEYRHAIRNRVKYLRKDFNYIFDWDDDGFSIQPAIWEGLIKFLWFPPSGLVPLGAIFQDDFNNGMPLMLVANCGASVCRSHILSDIYLSFEMLG